MQAPHQVRGLVGLSVRARIVDARDDCEPNARPRCEETFREFRMDTRTLQRIQHLVPAGATASDYIDVLRLTTQQLEMLQEMLNQAEGERPSELKRKIDRYPASCFGPALLELKHPSGGEARFIIYPLDISTGGIAILHGSFIHPKSKVRIRLALPGGDKLPIEGLVTHCHYLRGKAHVVGIGFTRPIPEDMLKIWIGGSGMPSTVPAPAAAARASESGLAPTDGPGGSPAGTTPPAGVGPSTETLSKAMLDDLHRIAAALAEAGQISAEIREATDRLISASLNSNSSPK